MNQPAYPPTKPVQVAVPGLPGQLNPAQRADALLRLETQAQQRLRLGLELFNAADTQANRNRQALEEVKNEQAAFRAEVQDDLARSLHAYDAWLGEVDANLADSIKALEEKMDRLTREWEGTRAKIEGMVKRSEVLLTQTRDLVATGRPNPPTAPQESAASPESNRAAVPEP